MCVCVRRCDRGTRQSHSSLGLLQRALVLLSRSPLVLGRSPPNTTWAYCSARGECTQGFEVQGDMCEGFGRGKHVVGAGGGYPRYYTNFYFLKGSLSRPHQDSRARGGARGSGAASGPAGSPRVTTPAAARPRADPPRQSHRRTVTRPRPLPAQRGRTGPGPARSTTARLRGGRRCGSSAVGLAAARARGAAPRPWIRRPSSATAGGCVP